MGSAKTEMLLKLLGTGKYITCIVVSFRRTFADEFC